MADIDKKTRKELYEGATAINREHLKEDRGEAWLGMSQCARNTPGYEFAKGQYEDAVRQLKSAPATKVTKEPDLYSRDNPNVSWLLDVAAASNITLPISRVNPHQAQERLLKHELFMEKRLDKNAAKGVTQTRDLGGSFQSASGTPMNTRGLSDVSASLGQTFVPPSWISSMWVEGTRAASVFARLLKSIPLPDGVTSIILPTVLDSSDPYGPPAELEPIVGGLTGTGYLTSKVVIMAGTTKLSQVLVDRGPNLDEIMVQNSLQGYAQALDYLLVNGDNSGDGITGEPLGIRSIVPTANYLTDSGTYSAGALVSDIADVAQLVATNRRRTPTEILLYTPRWFGLAGSSDSVNEPFLRPGIGNTVTGSSDPFGPLLNLPVYLTYAVGDAGADDGYDAAFVIRSQDMILWEGTPRFQFMPEAGGQDLTNLFQWHTYISASLNRFPYSIGYVSGSAWTFPPA
jgi:hypothetical protein